MKQDSLIVETVVTTADLHLTSKRRIKKAFEKACIIYMYWFYVFDKFYDDSFLFLSFIDIKFFDVAHSPYE